MAGANKLMTSGGGGVIITPAANIASDVTVNVPSQNCTLGIQGPAFSAYKSSNQTISASTFTKITFDVEEFDTNNNFASSRFTPTVAGYYQINADVNFAPINDSLIVIYKNGTAYKWGTYTTAGVGPSMIASSLVYLNGSTDYVEIYVYAGTTTVYGTSTQTWVNGFLARGA